MPDLLTICFIPRNFNATCCLKDISFNWFIAYNLVPISIFLLMTHLYYWRLFIILSIFSSHCCIFKYFWRILIFLLALPCFEIMACNKNINFYLHFLFTFINRFLFKKWCGNINGSVLFSLSNRGEHEFGRKKCNPNSIWKSAIVCAEWKSV